MKPLASKTNSGGPTSTWPYGFNKNTTGTGDGSLLDVDQFSDAIQFFERIIALSGVTANGLFDNADNGFQLYEAFENLCIRPPLSALGSFNTAPDFDISVAGSVTVVSIGADDDNVYIGWFDSGGGIYLVDGFSRKTGAAAGLGIIVSANPEDIEVDDTHIYVLVSGVGVKAYLKSNGSPDVARDIAQSGARLAVGDGITNIVTSTQIYRYVTSTGASLTNLTGLTNVTCADMYRGRLYIGNSANTTVDVYDSLNTLEFSIDIDPSGTKFPKDIACYGGKISALLDGGGASDRFTVTDAQTGQNYQLESRTLASLTQRIEASFNQLIIMNPVSDPDDVSLYNQVIR